MCNDCENDYHTMAAKYEAEKFELQEKLNQANAHIAKLMDWYMNCNDVDMGRDARIPIEQWDEFRTIIWG